MITLGEIFRRYGPAYRAQYGDRMLPSHRAAMPAIEACRTEALGGHVYTCPACATTRYSYHSCRNRHCPTCQQDAAQTWLARQQELLLPVPYFLVTFTLPSGLRDLARTPPAPALHAALSCLGRGAPATGPGPALPGWADWHARRVADLDARPALSPARPLSGAGACAGTRWDAAADRAIRPSWCTSKPLAVLFRAKLRAALRQTDLYAQVAPETWQQAWVVDCRAVGSGAAALKYLAPYIFRVALSNNRIVGVAERPRDVSLSRWQDQADPYLHVTRADLHRALSAACLAKRVCEGALLWAVQSAAAAATGAASAALAGGDTHQRQPWHTRRRMRLHRWHRWQLSVRCVVSRCRLPCCIPARSRGPPAVATVTTAAAAEAGAQVTERSPHFGVCRTSSSAPEGDRMWVWPRWNRRRFRAMEQGTELALEHVQEQVEPKTASLFAPRSRIISIERTGRRAGYVQRGLCGGCAPHESLIRWAASCERRVEILRVLYSDASASCGYRT